MMRGMTARPRKRRGGRRLAIGPLRCRSRRERDRARQGALAPTPARWIAERIAFAPGMAAMVDVLGSDRVRVLDTFVAALERDQGKAR